MSWSSMQARAQSQSPPQPSWQHLPSHRASRCTGVRRNHRTWEPEAPYLSHCQDKVHRWVLWINPLQLHPHFKAVLVLGSYLVLETKIKLQCKKTTQVVGSRTIPRSHHQATGAAGTRRLWATGYVIIQILILFPYKNTFFHLLVGLHLLLLAGQGVPRLTAAAGESGAQAWLLLHPGNQTPGSRGAAHQRGLRRAHTWL